MNVLKNDDSELLELADTFSIEHDGQLTLDIIEEILTDENTCAGHARYITSEEELSQRFDDYLAECYPDFPLDDEPMLNETFSNWMDSLLSDNELHELQVNNYCYIGKHAE